MSPTIDHSREFQSQILKHGDKDRQIERLKYHRALLLTVSLALAVLVITLACILRLFVPAFIGTFPFGPTKTVTVTVQRLYVDYSGGKESSSSHYMVGTDAGVFECDNSLWLGIWNADEIYSSLKAGEKYTITTKGKKVTNFFMQEYPGITAVAPVGQIEKP